MILSILSLIHSNNLINAERYRSGHNEAVLKTVCRKGAWVRIPPSPVEAEQYVLLFLLFGLVFGEQKGEMKKGKIYL